jgi:mono/diheme cytochrome c family protein
MRAEASCGRHDALMKPCGIGRFSLWKGRHPGATWALPALLLLAPLSIGKAQRPAGPTQSALAGSWIFGAKGCSKCHAINGVGNSVGPDLGRGEIHSYYDLGAAFWNHYPGMAARMRKEGIQPPRMSPGEMGDLIAFLTSVNYFGPAGNSDKGKTLFAEKSCIRCHQVGGAGGVVGPNLDFLGQTTSPIEVAAAMWNHAPAMSEKMQALGVGRPTFTGPELTDLLAYLRAASPGLEDRPLQLFPGRVDLGRKWFAEKSCIRCHSIRGQGGTYAPDLASRERPLGLIQFSATLWNKAPAMNAKMRELGIEAPQLDAGQMADLVAYLYSVQYFRPQGNAATGQGLLDTRGCLRCHSLKGRGAKGAADLAKVRGLDSPVGVIAAMWNHGRLVPGTTEAGSRWPKLTAEELADIAAFFLGARPAR